ncbi:MAG: FHA domain-containing protein [Richelia sp. SL_2_1]|nr:FHA domain-containing protein [Richelia sp. SM1_7_0]NJO26109.1 FHA domain-containing protein [Richelia sp. SL_2_1]
MKIKAINYQTSSCQEKILTPEMENLNKCIIGRHPNCDLVLNAPEVSRIHGMIYAYQQNYYFIDLASSDGSRINNQEMEGTQSYLLKPNDVIHIGDFLLLIEEIQLEEHQSNQFTAWRSPELTARCVRIINETPDVKTFTFVAEPAVEFTYQPGQFVTVELEINGKIVKRAYSISSTPSRPHSLDITVKRASSPNNAADAPPGLVSNWLHDNLQAGSQVKIGSPLGDFSCVNHPSSKLLFISAGSGITPMMSMSRWLLDTNAGSDIVFFHSAGTTEDIIFRQELELMTSRYANFKLATTLTRQDSNPISGGKIGRFDQSMLQEIASDFAERTVYVCGSQPFTQQVKAILQELEFPMQNYYEESFGKPYSMKKDNQIQLQTTLTPKEITTSHTAETLVLAKSGVELVYDSADTILETAQREGIELPHMCKMGACQKCKLRLIEGEVRYDQDPECQAGYILTCIAQPVGRVVIEA